MDVKTINHLPNGVGDNLIRALLVRGRFKTGFEDGPSISSVMSASVYMQVTQDTNPHISLTTEFYTLLVP